MYLILFITALSIIFEPLIATNALNMEPLSRNKRLVGGEKSTIEKYPYLVSLELDSQHMCGGSIISRLRILTAAHCLSYKKNLSSYRVRAGSTFIERGGTVYKLRNFTIHYDYAEGNNDLAVIQLEEPIKFDSTKQPIGMFDFDEESKNGSTAIVAGWGLMGFMYQPTRLRSVELNTVDENLCRDNWIAEYDRVHPNEKFDKYNLIQKSHICAWEVNKFKSICYGDSGSPLIIAGKVAGITSFVHRGCTSWSLPNVFTKVAYFRNWIDEQNAEIKENLLIKGIPFHKIFNISTFGIVVSFIILAAAALLWICQKIESRSPSKHGYIPI